MTKEDAQKKVQENVAKITELMKESEKLMDEHGFTAYVGDMKYMPRGATFDDEGYSGQANIYLYGRDYEWMAGEWMTSSQWKDC